MAAQVLPMAATETWRAVMERAGYRCECNRCPLDRRSAGGRCEAEDRPGARLLAGPLSPGPNPARTIESAPPDELVAWCGPCWDRAVSASRRHSRTLAKRAPAEGLW
jgi:hypothetical protein